MSVMKRRLAAILGLLILGAIINIAVAWGCVRWSIGHEQSRFVSISDDDHAWLQARTKIPFNDFRIMSDEDVIWRNEEFVEREQQPDAATWSVRDRINLLGEDSVLEIVGKKEPWDGNVVYNDTPIDGTPQLELLADRTIGREFRRYHLSLWIAPGFGHSLINCWRGGRANRFMARLPTMTPMD